MFLKKLMNNFNEINTDSIFDSKYILAFYFLGSLKRAFKNKMATNAHFISFQMTHLSPMFCIISFIFMLQLYKIIMLSYYTL